jgi:hypothetical protein
LIFNVSGAASRFLINSFATAALKFASKIDTLRSVASIPTTSTGQCADLVFSEKALCE